MGSDRQGRGPAEGDLSVRAFGERRLEPSLEDYGVRAIIPTPFFTVTVAPNAFERVVIISRIRAASAPDASFGRPRSERGV